MSDVISDSKTKQLVSSAGAVYNFTVSFYESDVLYNDNVSIVVCSLSFEPTNGYWTTSYPSRLELYWYDDFMSSSGTLLTSMEFNGLSSINDTKSLNVVKTVPHNSYGTLQGYVKGVFIRGNTTSTIAPTDNDVQTSPPMSLTEIPRGFTSTPYFSLDSMTETSTNISWHTSENCDKVDYQINNNPKVTNAWTGNATTGIITINNLSPGETFSITLWCRRKDTGVENKTGTRYFRTYQYPNIIDIMTPNLKIGDYQALNIYNPMGRTITVYMKQNNTSGTVLHSTTLQNSGTYTFTPNSNILYNSIPNSPLSRDVVYYCEYDNHIVSTKSGTYYMDINDTTFTPVFTDTNWSYSASNTNLTNDDQIIIKNKSDVTISVDTSATPYTGASIDSYIVEWGTLTGTISGSTGSVTLSNGSDSTLKVTAVDSRGYNTVSTISLGDNLIDYNDIIINAETEREDGISTDTVLQLNGTFYNDTFGTNGVQNEIVSAKYYVYDNNTWSQGYTIPINSFVINNNNYSYNGYIHANGSSGGFPIGTRYVIKVEVTDKVGTTTLENIPITDGKIAVDCYQDSNGNYHRGINGLADPNYTLYVHGNIGADSMPGGEVANSYSNREDIPYSCNYINGLLDVIYPIGSIYMSVNSTSPQTLFGGTWAQIKDSFLLACGDTYANASTGGSATNSHTHSYAHTHGVPGVSHGHNLTGGYAQLNLASSGTYLYANMNTSVKFNDNYYMKTNGSRTAIANDSTTGVVKLGGTADNTTPGSTTTNSQSTSTTGAASDTNNMPPYLAVYVWKRTA